MEEDDDDILDGEALDDTEYITSSGT